MVLEGGCGYITTPEQFGAIGDGKANDSKAIQQAVASCANYASCQVLFSKTYLSSSIDVGSSGVTLNITGNLFMLPKKDYKSTSSFVTCSAPVRNVRITGEGTIGIHNLENAIEWWACKITGCSRPYLVVMSGVVGVRIDGGLHFLNSPNHNICFRSCTGVRVDNIYIKAPLYSPNTDGINFYGGKDQSLTNSVIENGDDCVSVVPIGEWTPLCVNSPNPNMEGCRGGNVVVRNVMCRGGHGISIGGVRHGTVSNVTFSNMTATGGLGNTQGLYSSGGLRVKSYPNSTGSVYDILYEDIVLDGVYMPLQLLAHYCPWPCKTPDGKHAAAFHGITFRNVQGTGRQSTQGAFECSPFSPCSNITLDNVHLGTSSGTYTCSNATLVFDGSSNSPSACT